MASDYSTSQLNNGSQFNSSFFETIRPVKEIRFQLPLIVYSRSRDLHCRENVRPSRTVEKPLQISPSFSLSLSFCYSVKYFESTTIYCNCSFLVAVEDITHDIYASNQPTDICIRHVLACAINVLPLASWIDYRLYAVIFVESSRVELRFRYTVVYRKSI